MGRTEDDAANHLRPRICFIMQPRCYGCLVTDRPSDKQTHPPQHARARAQELFIRKGSRRQRVHCLGFLQRRSSESYFRLFRALAWVSAFVVLIIPPSPGCRLLWCFAVTGIQVSGVILSHLRRHPSQLGVMNRLAEGLVGDGESWNDSDLYRDGPQKSWLSRLSREEET